MQGLHPRWLVVGAAGLILILCVGALAYLIAERVLGGGRGPLPDVAFAERYIRRQRGDEREPTTRHQ